ncbi:MAG: WD40 repeat domain-containing protein [Anaerolineae bacterium]
MQLSIGLDSKLLTVAPLCVLSVAGVLAGCSTQPDDLVGRLVWLEVADNQVENAAKAMDLATGNTESLWTTGHRTNVSDVALSPDGRWIAYRVVEHDAVPPEAIVARRLEPGAEPQIIAETETDVARLTGFAWSPDGTAIAYGRQQGHLRVGGEGEARPFERWEVHIVPAGDAVDSGSSVAPAESLAWAVDGSELGPVALDVVGWSPAANVVAASLTSADGGASQEVLLIDTKSGEIRDRVPSGALQFDLAGSPDGLHLALPDADVVADRVRILSLATGELLDVPGRLGSAAGAPLWSPDGRFLAWSTGGCRGPWQAPGDDGGVFSGEAAAPCTVGVVSVDDLGSGAAAIASAADPIRALAFDPEGKYLLIGEDSSDAQQERRALTVHRLDGSGSGWPLGRDLPEMAWFAAWVP